MGTVAGDVVSNIMKSEPGHHRFDVRGPSNGHPDFVALLCCSSSAIDALSILYGPKTVFCQFLGSVSLMIFPFLSLLPLLVLSFSFIFVFSLFFHFLFLFFSLHFIPFLSFLFFHFFDVPTDLSLSCVCVVTGTTRNTYVVVVSEWHAM